MEINPMSSDLSDLEGITLVLVEVKTALVVPDSEEELDSVSISFSIIFEKVEVEESGEEDIEEKSDSEEPIKEEDDETETEV